MNRFFFICILTTLALFTSSKVKAQFDVHFNQYWDLKGFYNPAWAGQTDKLNIAGTYSMQMMGFTHSPRTMYFGADMPFSLFNKKHGAGAGFFATSVFGCNILINTRLEKEGWAWDYNWVLSVSRLIRKISI